MKYTRQSVYDIILIVKKRYYTETVIQIFKTYTVTLIRCYIGIVPRILTNSSRMDKRVYGLHVIIEVLYNDIRERCSKNIEQNFFMYSPVFCPNTGEYGAKKAVFTVVLWSKKD